MFKVGVAVKWEGFMEIIVANTKLGKIIYNLEFLRMTLICKTQIKLSIMFHNT